MSKPFMPSQATRTAAIIVAMVMLFLAAVSLQPRTSLAAQAEPRPRVLLLGGGTSHDFDRMYGEVDRKTLAAAGDDPRYITSLADLAKNLQTADVLLQASNQTPEPDSSTRQAILDFVNAGGGLIVAHAGVWYNWPSWPEYNRLFIAGGTRSHDRYGEFEVTVTAPNHPVVRGVATRFKVSDELYHQEMDPKGSPVEVLATATSPLSGKTYPAIWIVHQGRGRIVCMILGHDDKTHADPAYQRLLVNAAAWTATRKNTP